MICWRFIFVAICVSSKRIQVYSPLRRSWIRTHSCKNNIIRRKLEQAAQSFWDENKVFSKAVAGYTKRSSTAFSIVPYPSGRHAMGHVRNYTIGDVFLATSACSGKNVLQTLWVGMLFGLPAEKRSYSSTKQHKQMDNWKHRLHWKASFKELGFALWLGIVKNRNSVHLRLLKWEQWFFTQISEKAWRIKKTDGGKWCPEDQTF